jgi:hypothetical protein
VIAVGWLASREQFDIDNDYDHDWYEIGAQSRFYRIAESLMILLLHAWSNSFAFDKARSSRRPFQNKLP